MRKSRTIIYDEIFIPEFGTRLLKAIKNKGITQRELSLRLGFDASTINGYVSGKRYPSVPTLKAICEILNISSDYLLELKEESKWE